MTDHDDNEISNLPARRVCGAQLRGKPGRFCQQNPLLGRDRCKFHGGASPRGTESPNWRGKGYSKDLPTALADRVETMRKYNTMVSTIDEIELIIARVGELAESLETMDGTVIIDTLQQCAEALRAARDNEDWERVMEVRDQLKALMSEAQHVKRTWAAIFEGVELKRRLVETQLKREQLESTTMTASQAMTFVAEVKQAALDEITDPDMRARFMLRVQARLGEAVSARQLKPAVPDEQ